LKGAPGVHFFSAGLACTAILPHLKNMNNATNPIINRMRAAASTRKVAVFAAVVSVWGLVTGCTTGKHASDPGVLIARIMKYADDMNPPARKTEADSLVEKQMVENFDECQKNHPGKTRYDVMVRARMCLMRGLYCQSRGRYTEAMSWYRSARSFRLPVADPSLCIADLHYDLVLVDLLRKDSLYIDTLHNTVRLSVDSDTKIILERVKTEFDNSHRYKRLDDTYRFETGTVPSARVRHRETQIREVLDGNGALYIDTYHEAAGVIGWYEKIHPNDTAGMHRIQPLKERLARAMDFGKRAASDICQPQTTLQQLIDKASIRTNYYDDEYGGRYLLTRAAELFPDSARARYNLGYFLFCFFRLQDGLDEGEMHLRKALELDPGMESARTTLDTIEKIRRNK
jgi:hypothetical protein